MSDTDTWASQPPEQVLTPSITPTGRSAADLQRQDDLWNNVALVAFLGAFGLAASGAVVAALVANLGRQLEVIIGFSCLAITAGIIALIIYVLTHPLHDQPRVPRVRSGASDDYSTLAIVAFVAAFLTTVPGIVLGHLALSEIGRTGKRGRGLAIAALIVGYGELVLIGAFWLLIIVAVHR